MQYSVCTFFDKSSRNLDNWVFKMYIHTAYYFLKKKRRRMLHDISNIFKVQYLKKKIIQIIMDVGLEKGKNDCKAVKLQKKHKLLL